jgi:hypothetical protein
MDARQADGPNTARSAEVVMDGWLDELCPRYVLSKLWDGEGFYLSIDAHMHFMMGWDQVLLDMMSLLPSNAIVTHYPVAAVSSTILLFAVSDTFLGGVHWRQ